MTDTEPFALIVVLTAAAGLVALLSNRLTERVKIPSPALVLAGGVSRSRSSLPCTRLRSWRWSGWSPQPWALGVRLRDEPSGVHRLTIKAGSPADGATIDDLPGLPGDAWVSFVVRDSQLAPITGDTALRPGDDVLVLADPSLRKQLITAFEGPSAK